MGSSARDLTGDTSKWVGNTTFGTTEGRSWGGGVIMASASTTVATGVSATKPSCTETLDEIDEVGGWKGGALTEREAQSSERLVGQWRPYSAQYR
jgi:hypothetical protein